MTLSTLQFFEIDCSLDSVVKYVLGGSPVNRLNSQHLTKILIAGCEELIILYSHSANPQDHHCIPKPISSG